MGAVRLVVLSMLLACATLAAAAIESEDGVLVLTDENFDDMLIWKRSPLPSKQRLLLSSQQNTTFFEEGLWDCTERGHHPTSFVQPRSKTFPIPPPNEQ